MERFARDNIQLHLTWNNLLKYALHVCMPNVSTLTNLLCAVEYFSSLDDAKQDVDMVFLDLSQAINEVIHRLLFVKLEVFSIFTAVRRWVASFLANRSMRIWIEDFFITWYASLQRRPPRHCRWYCAFSYRHKRVACVHRIKVLFVRGSC